MTYIFPLITHEPAPFRPEAVPVVTGVLHEFVEGSKTSKVLKTVRASVPPNVYILSPATPAVSSSRGVNSPIVVRVLQLLVAGLNTSTLVTYSPLLEPPITYILPPTTAVAAVKRGVKVPVVA